jgi:O-antigen/teichoic acid export membrane protein
MAMADGPARASEQRRRGSVAQLLGASYLITLLAVVSGPVVARALGPTDRGLFASVVVYGTVVVQLLNLGVNLAVAHALTNRLHPPERLLGAVLRFTAVTILPACLAAITTVGVLLDDLHGWAAAIAVVTIASAPLGVLGLSLQSFLLAAGALRPLAYLRLAPILANFVFVMLLVATGRLTLETYLALYLSLGLLTAAATFRAVGVHPSGSAPLGPLLRFGLRGYPGSFGNLLNIQLDQVLLAALVAPAQLAFYAIAVTISNVPQMIGEAVAARALGGVAGDDRALEPSRAETYFRMNVLVCGVSVAAIAALAPTLVPLLYGQAFAPVVEPLLLLLPGALALAAANVAGLCLIVLGRPGVTSMAEIAALAVTAVGLALTLRPFGILGAAAVSSAAYTLRLAIQLGVLRRYGVRRLVPTLADCELLLRLVRARITRTPVPSGSAAHGRW